MPKLEFNDPRVEFSFDNNDFEDGVPLHLWEKSLPEYIESFHTELDTNIHVSTRILATSHEGILDKLSKRILICGKKTNKKTITACAMEWGRSRMMSIPEYKSLKSERSDQALAAINGDYARAYRSRENKSLFKHVQDIEDLGKPYTLQATESIKNWISETAPLLKMNDYELGLFILYVGILYGDKDESQYKDNLKLTVWEKKNLTDVIVKVQEHLLSLKDQIRHFEYVQSIAGTNLFTTCSS